MNGFGLISGEAFESDGYPHAAWTWLRRNDPVRYFEPPGCDPFWAVTRYKDIVEVGKNPAGWANEPRFAVLPAVEMPEDIEARHLLTMDPPDHGLYRNMISKAFTPRSVRVWEPKIRDITRRALDRAGAKGEIDFVADVSAPITIEVIALMLGVPEEDWHLLFGWTNRIIAPGDPDNQKGATTQETFDRAQTELFAYFKEIADERRTSPTGDIISQIVHGKVNGAPLNDFELLSYFFMLVVAGNETTRNGMTAGIQCFLDHPEQWASMVGDASLVEGAIEETIRWASPVVQFARTATRDQTLRDKKVREGEAVCLFFASANRDEDVFEDPFSFRIDRWPNRHLGFGRGEHVCLGAHLARLEMRTLYEQLRERLVEMERQGPFARVRSSLVGGVKRAPMKWILRPAGTPTKP
jgi:cholest-4-en-3-one 26-monooxygenase